jgi:hypothetical protein
MFAEVYKGKVIKTFFLGDVEITDSKTYLDKCVENYRSALNTIVGVRMIIKVWEAVKGISLIFHAQIERGGRIKYPKSER